MKDTELFYRVGKKKVNYEVNKLKEKKQLMIDYLKLKVSEGDWHGVADAAMDIREIDSSLITIEGLT